MKCGILVLILTGLLGVAEAQMPGAAAKPFKFPEKKWFDEAKGYAEALELQKQTGADILIYFAQYTPSEKKGLCHWFEQRALQESPLSDGLKEYLKVKATFPLGKKEELAFEKLRVNSAPSLFIVQTNGRSSRVGPFDYPNGKPELKEAEVLMKEIRAKSGPRYQAAEDAK